MEASYSLERHCYDGVCHCDWRLTLYNCIESQAIRNIYIATIIISVLVSVVVFCSALGIRLLEFYIVSHRHCTNFIGERTQESHKSISKSWLPSPRTVDIIGLTLLCSPFFTNNTLSLTAGIVAKSKPKVAACVTTAVLYCGSRLIQTLNKHLKKFNPTGERYKKVKSGLFKIYSIMSLIAACLFLFGAQCLIYGAIRDLILKNYIGSVFLCAIWNLLAPATTVFVEISILFSPQVNDKPKIIPLESSGNEQTTTVFDTQNAIKSSGGANMTFEDTLTNGALENLNMKYENALNKHNGKPAFGLTHHEDNYHLQSSTANPLYIDDIEVQDGFYELQRQNSRVKLIDKKY
ncbi:hypothetical protein K501DRAFT_278632 [Backusella circina FSU 941]|nr:hypothetical protein K501DRAFT_278632 [Backusella circina FSU 941]